MILSKQVWWTEEAFLHIWHGIDQTIIDIAIDEWCEHLRICMQAKGGQFEQLSLQYSAIWQETFQFSSNVAQWTNCVQFFLFKFELLLSQGSATTYWRHAGKCYISFVGNLVIFPAVKEFGKSAKNW